jgi:hypothetical protein
MSLCFCLFCTAEPQRDEVRTGLDNVAALERCMWKGADFVFVEK